MSLLALLLLPFLLLPTVSADHISWNHATHYPVIRHELTDEAKNAFARFSEPLPTTAGKACIQWDAATRTLTTRSWGRGNKDGTARYTEKIQKLSADGMQLSTLMRSKLYGSNHWGDGISISHTAAKPYFFVYPPSDIVDEKYYTFETWNLRTDGTLDNIRAASSDSKLLYYIHTTPPLKEPSIKLMDGVQPFPAPADEPILTDGNSYHRRPKAAVYDPSTRILTWECRRHPGKKQNYKALGPFNIYQFRVAPDNKSVEITRRIYCSGYTAPLLRTCRLTTDTPGRFTDSYGYLYYFTLTPDGHIATYSRSPGANDKRDNGSREPVFIYPPKQK